MNRTSQRRGSDGYRSPELLRHDYGKEVDIWSMGCILYEMASGRRAFVTDGDIWGYFFQKLPIRMSLDKIQSEEAAKNCIKGFVLAMLCITPSERPKASHLFIQFSDHCLAIKNGGHGQSVNACCLHELETINNSSSRIIDKECVFTEKHR